MKKLLPRKIGRQLLGAAPAIIHLSGKVFGIKDHGSRMVRFVGLGCKVSTRKLYSHSIVPGGLDVMSYTTRLIPRISFTIRLEILFNTS